MGSAMGEKPQLSDGHASRAAAHAPALPRASVRRDVPAVPRAPRPCRLPPAPLPPSACAPGRVRGDAAGAIASVGGYFAVGGHAGLSDAVAVAGFTCCLWARVSTPLTPRVCTRFSSRPMLSCAG